MMQAMTNHASGRQRAQFPYRCKGDRTGAGSRGARQRFPLWCNKTEDRKDGRKDVIAEPTTASPPALFAGEDHLLSG